MLRTKVRVVQVTRVQVETPTVNTVFFRDTAEAKPGQFVMVWVPGVDEVPISLSYIGEEKGVSVKSIGEATRAISSLKTGDRIGIRGPFGNGFELKGGRILAVGGGSGIATIAPAIDYAKRKNVQMEACIGARSKDELLFKERMKKSAKVHIATDDGSEGFRGFVPQLVEELLSRSKYHAVISCGPEKMIYMLYEMSVKNKIDFQASMERYMKCAMGLCDSCAFGPYLVCRDGPVFASDRLANVKDFGKFKRDSSGKMAGI